MYVKCAILPNRSFGVSSSGLIGFFKHIVECGGMYRKRGGRIQTTKRDESAYGNGLVKPEESVKNMGKL